MAFDIPLHPEEGLELLRQKAEEEKPDLIIGTSMGGYGIDRIYIGEVGLGILKLLTCGGLGVWWLIDLFLIMERTRENNLNQLMNSSLP